MSPPAVVHNRGWHRRRRCHHRRRRRRRRRWRRRRAGCQCKSRDKSGRAERPASRDKTHVSPPRVESDTLYQPDTQSRAAQDHSIIAPSRLFSMGNLTSNHGNDDDPDLWRRGSPRRNRQSHPSASCRGRDSLRQRPSRRPIRANRSGWTPRAVGSLGHGQPVNEIRCPERQNLT